MKQKILVILGATATGKSDLAVTLAKKFNGEIVSADSRQVYIGMDLGTGKITKREMQNIPHHLLDIVSPKTHFSVSKYKKLAEKKMEEIISRGKLPILCGGTGFYIDSIVKNISLPEVPPNQKLRAQLAKKSAAQLFKILKKLSPARAETIDKNNPVRLIRAIEICYALGTVPQVKKLPSKYVFCFIGLDVPDEILKQRIALRLEQRFKAGMLREVQKLHASGVSWKRLESFGLEYREIAEFLQKKITREQMIRNLKKEIWQYVKRQRTWFKRDKNIQWFQLKEISQITQSIKIFLK